MYIYRMAMMPNSIEVNLLVYMQRIKVRKQHSAANNTKFLFFDTCTRQVCVLCCVGITDA